MGPSMAYSTSLVAFGWSAVRKEAFHVGHAAATEQMLENWTEECDKLGETCDSWLQP